ncbi:MAG TPA: DUF5685 family protein [Streptosporangiaceae bacterium]|nr:DUF5685 family protein [Streptosporangiaceae bacterium]
MFGIVRPCRHRLHCGLFGEWSAHLCGLCLTLRDLHGHSARLVTNYDGLLVSVLTEAQNPGVAPHRSAGPCALRRFRRADVLDASATGAQLAASISLVLAAGKIRDHVVDRDGAYARRLVAAGAGLAAGRWLAAGQRTGAAIGFDTALLTNAISRQADLERTTGLTLTEVTEPTETAVSAAFAHTAVLADRPGNAEPLAEAGRYFGRIAHLLDAVEDLADDEAASSYNPLVATGTDLAQAREHCLDALGGLRSAVALLELERPALTESLLAGEVGVAVDRVFKRILRENNLVSASWPSGPTDPGGPNPGGPGQFPGGPGPYPGADRPPGTEDANPQQPGQYDQMPGDVFKPAPWQQGNNPRQFRQQMTPPSGGECCIGCCEGLECCDCCECCDGCSGCDCG